MTKAEDTQAGDRYAEDHHGHPQEHDHAHEHAHVQAPVLARDPRNERRVAIAAALIGAFMLAEVAGGLISGSLALLADAGHMLTDFASLVLAWAAFRIARRPADWRRTYGFDRFQILAAFVNGLTLVFICAWIVVEAVSRLVDPVPVMGDMMLGIAIVGLIVNVAAYLVLHGADRANLNIRGAALHVLGDMLGSAAAIAAAVIILTTGWMAADPLLSLLVAAIILKGAWSILATTGHILLEGAPEGVDTGAIASDLVAAIGPVEEVHHVHAWSITPERPMVTLHARVAENAPRDAVIRAIKDRLSRQFNVGHATVEIEGERCADVPPPDRQAG